MDMTAEDMLKEVNNAIFAIMVGGQEYRIGSRHLKRADLNMLRQMKNELEAKTASGAGNGLLDNAYAVHFDRR